MHLPRWPAPRHQQPLVSRAARSRIFGGKSLLKILHTGRRHGSDEIVAVDPDRLAHMDQVCGDLDNLLAVEARRLERLPMIQDRVDVHRFGQSDAQIRIRADCP